MYANKGNIRINPRHQIIKIMVSVSEFYNKLAESDIEFFCGVPDSLLKSFCAFVSENTSIERNIITSNEGAAVALASGYHIGTGKIPFVYFQNSGLGNAINPLLSLADPEVYSIPMILLIGWRGEPGLKDEPQHIKQGKVTLELLDAMSIPYVILDANSNVDDIVNVSLTYCKENKAPFAIVVRKDSFSDYRLCEISIPDIKLTREDALKVSIENIPRNSIIISTTGMLSRELFELRKYRGESHQNDFLTVGSMGHTSQIALGIALSNPDKTIYCFEGDGAAIMHLGSYAVTGNHNLNNLKIILFNNGAHDSVGGQPTVGFETDFQKVFKGFRFKEVRLARNEEDLKIKIEEINQINGTCLLEIIIKKGARKDLGRPTQTPLEGKHELMKTLNVL